MSKKKSIQPVKPTDEQVKKLAKEFSKGLYADLGVTNMGKINKQNKTDYYKNNRLCATHDYCDSNMVMDEAFTKVMGREYVFSNDEEPETEKQNEYDTAAMNKAWSMAKENNFYDGKFEDGGKPLGSTGLFKDGGSAEQYIISADNNTKFVGFDFNQRTGVNNARWVKTKELAYLFPSIGDAYEAEDGVLRDFLEDTLQYVVRYSDLKPAIHSNDTHSMYAKGGKASIELPGCNLWLSGFGMDANGNSIVKVGFPNDRAFSIQTNGTLPKTNRIQKGSPRLADLTEKQLKEISKEVSEYIKEFGSLNQKTRLKKYSFFADGGKPLGSTGLFAKGGKAKQVDTSKYDFSPLKPSQTADSPRIYVADLAAYNEGHLVGEWLDMNDYSSGEEVIAAIHDLLKKWSKKAKTKREEFAIHDTDNMPKEFRSEYLGVKDFDKFYRYKEVADEIGIPFEVVADWTSDKGSDVESAQDAYQGEYDDMEDYAYQMVQEGTMQVGTNIYITDTDRRIISQEEADSRYDGIDDEDELIKDADLTDELDELESKQVEKTDVEAELETAEEEEIELNNELDALNEKLSAAKNKKEIAAIKTKIDKKTDEISSKEDEVLEIKSRAGEFDDFDFDTAKTELADKAREQLKDTYSDEVYKSLEDPIEYFVNEQGIYTEEELVKQSFVSIDYKALATELGYEYTEVSHNGRSYIFSDNYAKGGKVKKSAPAKDYGTIKEGSTVTIVSEEMEKLSSDHSKYLKAKDFYTKMMSHIDDIGKVETVGKELLKVKFGNSTVTAPRKFFVRLAYKYGGKAK